MGGPAECPALDSDTRNVRAVRDGHRLVPEAALERKLVEALNFLAKKGSPAASFEGLPPGAEVDDEGNWLPGQYSMDYKFTRRFLTQQGVEWNRVLGERSVPRQAEVAFGAAMVEPEPFMGKTT